MKRLVLTAILISISICALCAVSIDGHVGVTTGVGVSFDAGEWKLGLDYESTIPVYAVGHGFVAIYFEDCSFLKGVELALFYCRAIDAYAYRNMFEAGDWKFSTGVGLYSAYEFPIDKFELIVKPGLRIDCGDFFAVMDLPVFIATFADGFSTPYMRFPVYNLFSVFTGWRMGYTYRIDARR